MLSDRVLALHKEVRSATPALCAERALLITEYFRDRADRNAPMLLQKAGALDHLLRNKRASIHAGELLVGNFTSHRVGGGLYPELHGVAMLEDLFRFEKRSTNPLKVSADDRRRLIREVFPYWLTRFLAMRAGPLWKSLRFIADQLDPTFYLINETGGISHFVPDYASLLAKGTEGIRQDAAQHLASAPGATASADLWRAIPIVCGALETFAGNYARLATRLAADSSDPARRRELEQIAETCNRVPRRPARSLREALQSILFAQIALNLESLDNAVSPGRLDQILWPYYQADRSAGALDTAGALELLGCFAVKLCEIIPAFSRRITRFHGGLFNGQVVVVGGVDSQGNDATNELSLLFLELMDELRTRQPNYHARVAPGSPAAYRARIARCLARGAASPALYNDAVIVPLLQSRGISQADARDYATVGCVEPVAAGKSFLSTDAALFNLPLCLELALNGGKRFGSGRQLGASTPPAERCASTQELCELFRTQVELGVERLLNDLRTVEQANARWHPTPLTSMFLDGCLRRGVDASGGGALYNGSGVQAVGAVDVGDSLAAIEEVVCVQRRASMAEVVAACRSGFDHGGELRARLRAAPKFGNDDRRADQFVTFAMQTFAAALDGHINTRGGDYVAGFYSVTAHEAFGAMVGALPSGRLRGEPFSSGLSPASGCDTAGPTAALLSQAALPLQLARNGINFNLEFPPTLVDGDAGAQRLQWLLDGGFAAGCMQVQVNVLDAKLLLEARDHPGRYPGLLVRVSGYSAYFDDLSPRMKQEIIDRTLSPSPPLPASDLPETMRAIPPA